MCDRYDRRRCKPFFSAAPEGDDHRRGIAKEAVDLRKRYEPREPVEVMKKLEYCHREIMTTFSPGEKMTFRANFAVKVMWHGTNYPLKNAKSQY